MVIVQLPNVVETFYRAFDEVISPFLSTGNSFWIMGRIVNFYKTELFYGWEPLMPDGEPRNKPFITFVGSRAGSSKQEKCHDPQIPSDLGYEHRQQLYRTIFVGVPRNQAIALPPYTSPGAKRVSSVLDAENIWGQLFMVINHEYKHFNERGIFNPVFPMIPNQEPHPDYHLVYGQLQIETRANFTRNTM